jgi:hypothetical protein
MAKKILLVLLSTIVIGALSGCGSGDDGGKDPEIPLNDPSSGRQPTNVTGAGGGTTGGAAPQGGTQTPTTD